MIMREEFEAWHKRVVAGCVATGLVSYARQMDEFKEAYFVVWEASRATIEIELPYMHAYPANEAASDQDYYIDEAKADMRHQCRKAIEAAGLKVKP